MGEVPFRLNLLRRRKAARNGVVARRLGLVETGVAALGAASLEFSQRILREEETLAVATICVAALRNVIGEQLYEVSCPVQMPCHSDGMGMLVDNAIMKPSSLTGCTARAV